MSQATSEIMRQVKETIDRRFAALDRDLHIHLTAWQPSKTARKDRGYAVKMMLREMGSELKDFLSKRKDEIEKKVETLKQIEDIDALREALIQELAPYPTKPDGATQETVGKLLDGSIETIRIRLDQIRNSLLMAYLEEAIRDWDDIKHVIRQRNFYGRKKEKLSIQTMLKGDHLAYQCLQQAIAAGIVPETTIAPLCYFDKSGSTVSAPYTDLPLIGVPITATMQDHNDLYAILHEMGHYVYWHLKPEICQAIEDEARKFDNGQQDNNPYAWREEIFADAFASLVGGEAYNRQFRQFLSSRAGLNINKFKKDDGHHPPILIRPYILDGSNEWDTLLEALGITKILASDKDTQTLQAEVKPALQTLAKFIKAKITENGKLTLIQPPQDIKRFRGAYVYPETTGGIATSGQRPSRLPNCENKPPERLEEYASELGRWDKDLDTIPWP
jgi:hypothetical protein